MVTNGNANFNLTSQWMIHSTSLRGTNTTLQGINISHLGKRKIIFKMPFFGLPWRVFYGKTGFSPSSTKFESIYDEFEEDLSVVNLHQVVCRHLAIQCNRRMPARNQRRFEGRSTGTVRSSQEWNPGKVKIRWFLVVMYLRYLLACHVSEVSFSLCFWELSITL